MLCQLDSFLTSVMKSRFDVNVGTDVRELRTLPRLEQDGIQRLRWRKAARLLVFRGRTGHWEAAAGASRTYKFV
jgi:hypothetical protein